MRRKRMKKLAMETLQVETPLIETNQILPLPRVFLEIVRGTVQHPLRCVHRSVFLIGSASDCDLVLGDPRFPEIHSYLLVSSDQKPSEVVFHRVAGPLVSLQGEPIESATVPDGGILRIDEILLQLHLDDSVSRVVRRYRELLKTPSCKNAVDPEAHDLRVFRDSA